MHQNVANRAPSQSQVTPTFRDPAGSLSFEADRVVRSIHPAARQSTLEFLESEFCHQAQQRGDLVAACIDDAPGGLRLIHPRIPVPTYPWEWTPSQWLAAAELTLALCEEALSHGWILKDATPLNILFVGHRPVFVDILSFEQHDPHASIWLAYGQYMRTFLLPLLMNRELSWPLALSLFKRDGYEPAELYQAMSWPQRLSRSVFWPITLPAWLERGKKAEATSSNPTIGHKDDSELAAHLLHRTLADLRRRTLRAMPRNSGSAWAEYQQTLTHYTAEQAASKREWVRAALLKHKPARVLDIGANTGEYSALATENGAEVIALERDAAAAERLFCMSRARSLPIQTIHADLARPTPAVGWENAESSALIPRLAGQCDLVLMLAVIHHLILMEQIPIPAIVDLAHRLAARHWLVEWVPVADPMYQSLMRGRVSLYGALAESDLHTACDGLFTLLCRQTLDNGRVLLFFEKSTQ
ncbi:class I SAM-dependent methyltransferase [Granulicella sp. WH15]|nr:class I SAM-dependent methyltransferase [Granulicella sp. WH15]